MLRKIEQNRDILSGEAVAVPASKTIRQKYTGIFEPRGSRLIVPREYSNQKTRITRGMVELRRELRMGEEVRLVLPFRAADMETVAHKLLDDPTLNGMKRGNELFGFRLFGHNMNTIGFPSTEELANYILRNYAHLFSGKDGREGVKHFQLFRFRVPRSQLREGPEDQKTYARPEAQGIQRTGKSLCYSQAFRARRNTQAKKREKETPAERAKRIEAQRIRQRQHRQRKWEDE
jgi:hypothetical protein